MITVAVAVFEYVVVLTLDFHQLLVVVAVQHLQLGEDSVVAEFS